MCGIAGYYNYDKEKPANADRVRKMTDVISHRGPDGEGFYVKANIGLGHRRLSIIDLDTGDQPMFNKNKTTSIIFNGEIYNFIELREELTKLGCVFKTTSDTEVIINAYDQWGIDCLSKFNGCWAFALWDETKQMLFLSRDRIGEKPLFYSNLKGSFVFGSEIKSLFEYGIPKEFRIDLLELYLVFTNIPTPYTFFQGIYKLKPGHYIEVKNGTFSEHKYWDLPELDESKMFSQKERIYNEFEELLIDSVKIRMRSDVPFGAFLSGGLDSSSIVAIMSGLSNIPVETFTIGFDHKRFDESKLAKIVSEKFKTNHNLHIVSPEDFDLSLSKIAFHFDEPFGDSSAIPTGYVSAFAREKVKMVLTGDGGDEVLSGYNSYQGIKITSEYNKLPRIIRNSIPRGANILAKYFSGEFRYKLNRLESVASTSGLSFNNRIINKMAYTDFQEIKKLVSPIKNLISAEDYFNDFMSGCFYKDDFYKLMYVNFKHNLPDDYLVKVDRMSMANSIEARVPFLDYRLIEFMCRVSKQVKMKGLERKTVLKRTIGRRLPQDILNAPKMGFGVPVREWFKQDNFNDRLNSLRNSNMPLDNKTIGSIIDGNKSGYIDNGNFIWSLFVLNKIM